MNRHILFKFIIISLLVNTQNGHGFLQYSKKTKYSIPTGFFKPFQRPYSNPNQWFLQRRTAYNGAIVFIDDDKTLNEGSFCRRSFDGRSGYCLLAYQCLHVVREYRKHGTKIDICSYNNKIPIICCPLDVKSEKVLIRKRISEEKCEEYHRIGNARRILNNTAIQCESSIPLIVGGENTYPGEYPHMAAIGWTRYKNKINWACGGSLINEKFILTAAHCTRLSGAPPDIARLGAQNLKRNTRAKPIDFKIIDVIRHPSYKLASYYHDIALIRLERSAIFSKYIRPACLWQLPAINAEYGVAIGWGRTEFLGLKSDELQKVDLKIISHKECSELYKNERKLPQGIIDQQFCAGYLSGGKDTCQGDSGGPIHITLLDNKCINFVIGITSFGKYCAAPNSIGVYTKVHSYLDWIESVAFNDNVV